MQVYALGRELAVITVSSNDGESIGKRTTSVYWTLVLRGEGSGKGGAERPPGYRAPISPCFFISAAAAAVSFLIKDSTLSGLVFSLMPAQISLSAFRS